MEKYDLIIVGAGPAGIFTAVELLRHGSKKKMLLVEKGKPVEKRHCPKAEVGHCVNCRPTCAITTGFSGAGAFSDGKLSLSYEVGGDLPTLIGEEFAQELIDYTDKIYLEFGADPHVEGIYTGEDIKEIRKNAIHAGLKLVDCPIRHLGTEKAQELYLAIQNYLADNGVEMRFNTECENIILEEEGCKGVLLKDGDSLLPVYADEVVIGIIRDKLNSDACRNGFILDGFPRSIPQAEALDAMGVKMDAVLSLEVPDETIIQRMSGRRVCRCGASYHVVYLPPKQDNLCDKCGDTLYIRDDDAEETVRKRLETYHAQTEPLKAFYAAKGILITVQGREDVEDPTADVFAALAGVQ